MYKAILFDLDGVLIDATEWHFEALNKALGLFGYTISREQHLGGYNGLPTRVKLVRLTKEQGLPEALHLFIFQMKQKYTGEIIRAQCRPDYQKLLMLKQLKSRGFKIAVCTNAIRSTARAMLEAAMLMEHIDLLLSNEDVKKCKPDPEMYLEAMRILGVEPKTSLIIEDNEHGIQAGRASGGNVLAVKGYHEVNWDLIESQLLRREIHA